MENQGDYMKRHHSEEVPQKEQESTSLDGLIIQKQNILNKEELIYINGKNTHAGKEESDVHEDEFDKSEFQIDGDSSF